MTLATLENLATLSTILKVCAYVIIKKTILIEKCSWDKYEIISKPFLIKLIFE